MKRMFVLVVLCSALAACGSRESDRAISGGAMGAGAGALVAGPTGAMVGAGAGAAAGALTDSDDIDLGKPLWR